MSKYTVGQRVVAIRDSKEGVVNIFGFGVYEGDAAMPGMSIDESWLQTMREVLAKELAKPVEEVVAFNRQMEHVLKGMKPDHVVRLRNFMLARGIGTNPRIRITRGPNEGRAVWGMECWWGDADEFVKKYEGKQIHVVPLDREPYPEDDAPIPTLEEVAG